MDYLDEVVRQINERLKPIEAAIVSGRTESFEEYKRLCGEIRGMLIARSIVTTLKDKVETYDE